MYSLIKANQENLTVPSFKEGNIGILHICYINVYKCFYYLSKE